MALHQGSPKGHALPTLIPAASPPHASVHPHIEADLGASPPTLKLLCRAATRSTPQCLKPLFLYTENTVTAHAGVCSTAAQAYLMLP